eukprot:TRINITY_DN7037_c0_g1_i3.p1 TRINITY_DN7037_c0_g1~~TRINITY_DN7037_c0_g1_i3.p1  ORF type:complete len:165 (+),score=28.73 TRINITY_DN7037_c0_g1_i3:147-641(+)
MQRGLVGSEMCIRDRYQRRVHGVVIVYDITDRESFEKLSFWFQDLDTYGNQMEQRIILGNKSDMEAERAVTLFEGKKFAAEHKVPWMECSAKTGSCITQAFNNLTRQIIKEFESNEAFRRIFSRSTLIPGPSETGGEGLFPSYKLHKDKMKSSKKSGKCSCQFI